MFPVSAVVDWSRARGWCVESQVLNLVLVKTHRVERLMHVKFVIPCVGVYVCGGDLADWFVSLDIVIATLQRFKITMSIAHRPRVSLNCEVNKYSLTRLILLKEPFFNKTMLGSNGKGVIRLSPHCYYPSLACRIPRLVSDRAYLGSFGTVNWASHEFERTRGKSEANPQVYVETPLHPEKLTVWCALSAGGIIGPYFKNDEGHNVTVNGDRYRAMITNFFIPELNNQDIQELWLQQDGATCHTARATIDLLKDTFGDRLISRFGPVN
ncbi:uncharacterized protein TNCV_4399771 [Trichonephila clavipes]|nr:uncharacterized protein TNCV_4399771 [Trichonephila clavipes]